MFYVAGKLLWYLLQPSSLIVAALIAGVLLASTSWRGLSRGLMWASAAAFLVCGVSPCGDALTLPLETRFTRPDLDRVGPTISGIIVLGGGSDDRAPDRRELAALNEAAERYTEAVVLAGRLPLARLVFTGGTGALLRERPPESQSVARLLVALGVPKDRLLLESQSRSTYENAAFSARLLKPKPGERWLLVTSAWHMPRSVGSFRKAGFTVEPWPVDFRTSGRLDLTRLPVSISEGLRRVDVMAREYVGLAAYYFSGRSSALFPGPEA